MTTQTATVTGLDELIERLDAAVQQPTPDAITHAVKETLEELVGTRALELPESLVRPKPEGYARRLLHLSDRFGYSVLAMTWGPGQGTALHDHSGMWCVEGVLCGTIEVTQYELLEEQGDRYRFRRQGSVHAGVGDAGALIPPFEYHVICNSSPTEKAVTLHVYAGEMKQCTIFVPADDGWHQRQERQLCYD